MNKDQAPSSKAQSIQPIPMQYRLPKRWLLARKKFGNTQQHQLNLSIEAHYKRILAKAKELTPTNQMIFERDYRNCNAENAFAMHSLMSNSIYLYLECDYSFNYRIEYAFNNCPFEAEIKKLLRPFVLVNSSKEIQLKPDFNTYFATVLNVQDKKYIHYL